MQRFTLASALVAATVYGEVWKDTITVSASDGVEIGKTDVEIYWDVNSAGNVQMMVHQETTLSGDFTFTSRQANKAHFAFCWEDTAECWMSTRADHTNNGYDKIQNYVAFSPNKRDWDQMSDWPRQGSDPDSWDVRLNEGNTEKLDWDTVEVASDKYFGILEEHEFTDNSFASTVGGIYGSCLSAYDLMVYGRDRQAMFGLYLEIAPYTSGGYNGIYVNKDVFVSFDPATAQQLEDLEHVNYWESDFKKDCDTADYDTGLSMTLRGEDTAIRVPEDDQTVDQNWWGTTVSVENDDGEEIATATANLFWFVPGSFSEETGKLTDFHLGMQVDFELANDVAFDSDLANAASFQLCWDDNNECMSTARSYWGLFGDHTLQNSAVFSSVKRLHDDDSYPSQGTASHSWFENYCPAMDAVETLYSSTVFVTDYDYTYATESGWSTVINRVVDPCTNVYDIYVNGFARDATIGAYVHVDGQEQYVQQKVVVAFRPITEEQKVDLAYIDYEEQAWRDRLASQCGKDDAFMDAEIAWFRGFRSVDAREFEAEYASYTLSAKPVVVIEDEEEEPEVVEEEIEEEEETDSGSVTVTTLCEDGEDCDIEDDLEDIAEGVGAFLVIVFIIIPLCICIGICWCVYCYTAKKCCCANNKHENETLK